MRLAVLTNDYPPHARGGVGVIAETYVRELEKRGYDVKIFFKDPELHGRSTFRRLLFHFKDLLSRHDIVDDVIAWKPEVLLTHNLTGCGFRTPSTVQWQGVRWIHFLHDVQLFEPSGKMIHGESWPFFRRQWRRIWAFLRRRAFGRPNIVVSPTQWLLDIHKEFGFFESIKTVVIPNPIGTMGDGSNDVVANAMRPEPHEFGRTAHAPTLLYVGRLDYDKGVHILIEAWERLLPQPRLVLIGDGELRDELLLKEEKNLIVLGPRPHNEVLGYMQEADIVVVPSLVYENQPTVILEALAAGCKVVATSVGGIPETLGKAGWIVPPGDVEALKKVLEAVLISRVVLKQEKDRNDILQRHAVIAAVSYLEQVLNG